MSEELMQDILDMAKAYFDFIEEEINDSFIVLLINSLVDGYKNARCYPSSYTDEMIEDDVEAYFSRKKTHVAMYVIPEMYGRIGAEGLSSLTDAGTVRNWLPLSALSGVTPIAEVV